MSTRTLFARLFGRKPPIRDPLSRHAVLDPARSRCFRCEALTSTLVMQDPAQRVCAMCLGDKKVPHA
jgi:hypothetical protein